MQSNTVKVFEFDGNNVTFYDKNGMLFVNATEMAKPFGNSKKPILWLRTSAAKSYIDEVAKVQKCTLADLQRVTKGGNSNGTWLQKDVAMEFARWLSPKFGLWCNKRIEELLTQGHTELAPQPKFDLPQTFSEALLLAAQQAKKIEEDAKTIQCQRDEIASKNSLIKEMKEDSDYCNTILRSQKCVPVTSIAQDYGYSASAFNIILRELGIQYRSKDGQWILTYKYKSQGYVSSETLQINSGDKQRIIVSSRWTQKGRKFLYEFLKSKGFLPLIEQNTTINN